MAPKRKASAQVPVEQSESNNESSKAPSTSSAGPSRRRTRKPEVTWQQYKAMMDRYALNSNPSVEERRAFAQTLGLSIYQVTGFYVQHRSMDADALLRADRAEYLESSESSELDEPFNTLHRSLESTGRPEQREVVNGQDISEVSSSGIASSSANVDPSANISSLNQGSTIQLQSRPDSNSRKSKPDINLSAFCKVASDIPISLTYPEDIVSSFGPEGLIDDDGEEITDIEEMVFQKILRKKLVCEICLTHRKRFKCAICANSICYSCHKSIADSQIQSGPNTVIQCPFCREIHDQYLPIIIPRL